MATKKITLNELRTLVKKIINEETMLNEDNLILGNYAKQLYSLFKKSGATPLIATGKNYASPDIKNYNVSIMVTNNGELMVGIKGVNKPTAEKYMGLVSKQFPDLELKGDIKFGTGWGGEQDSYADLTLVPKTTKKGGYVSNTQTSKPSGQQQPVSEGVKKITMSGLRDLIKEEISKGK